MDRSRCVKDACSIHKTDWAGSIQTIVDKTEYNLKGISAKDDSMHNPQPHTHSIPC